MAAGDIISGQYGTLHIDGTEATPVSNWTISLDGNLKELGANDADIHHQITGRRKYSGTFDLPVAEGQIIQVQHGARYRVEFHLDDSAASYYEMYVKIAEVAIDEDINDGDPVIAEVSWNGDGGSFQAVGTAAASSSA